MHDEPTLARIRRKRGVLSGNLYNQGLTFPGCEVAYTAALFVGASPEMAWEAARQHMLLELNPDVSPNVQTQARYAYGGLDRETERHRARADAIARVRALPNPFAQRAPVVIDQAA